ncbi:MAG: hypothetical protein QW429_03310, partial [Thermoprotei archaeon]
ARNVSGYINYTTSDNGGFPSYDANPGIIGYLEHEYNITFTFDNWTYSSTGGQTRSQFLYHYENYLLMSRFAAIRQEIAHRYGFGVVIDASDQNTGIYYEMGYVDGFTCWNCDEQVFGSWAGNGWYSNTSAAFGFEEWYGSIPSPSQVASSATNFMFNAMLLRPEASFIAWAWQFPTTQLNGTSTLLTAAKYDSEFEHLDGYGRFISNVGAQRYTVGTVYVNNSEIFYGQPVWMTPGQINEFHIGDQWLSTIPVRGVIANVGVYPQLTISSINALNFYDAYIMYPGYSGGTYWYQMYEKIFPQLIPTYFHNTTAFWVYDVFNTYVFKYNQTYYVLLDNFVGENRTVPFVYHNLKGYLAINIGGGGVIANSTNLTLPAYASDLIVLEPNQPYAPSLIYTNATSFSQSGGSIFLENPTPTTTVVTLQSDTSISAFNLDVAGGGNITLQSTSNNTYVRITSTGAQNYYTLTLPPFSQAWLSAYSTNTSNTGSSSVSQTTSTQTSPPTTSSSTTTYTSTGSTSSSTSTGSTSSSTYPTSQTTSTSTSTQPTRSSITTSSSTPPTSTSTQPTPTTSATQSATSTTSSTIQATIGGSTSGSTSMTNTLTQPAGSIATIKSNTLSSSLAFRKPEFLTGIAIVIIIALLGFYTLRGKRQ